MSNRKPHTLKVDAALFVNLYRAELIDLSDLVGRWLMTTARDLARYACELALYDVRRNYHHGVRRHR